MTDGSDDFDHKPPPITGALLKSAARALSDRLSIEVIGIYFAAQGAARGYWSGIDCRCATKCQVTSVNHLPS